MPSLLDKCVAVRDRVLATNGYRDNSARMMHVAAEPLLVTENELEEIRQRGERIFEFETFINGLYVEHFTASHNSRLVASIESSLDKSTRDVQRLIAQTRPLSVLKRTDESRPGFIVEVQKRCGGLCFDTSWVRAYREIMPIHGNTNDFALVNGFVEPYQWMMTDAQIRNGVLVLITPRKDLPSQIYLANLINRETAYKAIPVTTDYFYECTNGLTFDTDPILPLLTEYGFKNPFTTKHIPIGMFYRRETTLMDFVHLRDWDRIRDAYLAGNLAIQPELNLLEDTKIPVGLVSHPDIRDLMPKHLRSLFPDANLLPSDYDSPFSLGENHYTLQRLVEMPRLQRRFVIKYAGTNMEYGFGGRAVYRLRDMQRNQLIRVLDYALDQVQRGHIWVIQSLDMTYHTLSYLSKTQAVLHQSDRLYARYNFYYYFRFNRVLLIEAVANLRSIWKATSADDAIYSMVCSNPTSTAHYVDKGQGRMSRIVELG